MNDPRRPSGWLRFVQLDPFAKKWAKLGLGDDDLRALEIWIMSAGGAQPVVTGTGGLRKTRFSGARSDRSKRDSYRVCYALLPEYGIVLLVTIYAKNEAHDLGAADRKAIARVLKAIREQLDTGIIR